MATLAQLRTQISDVGKVFPPTSDTPETLGLADGVTTTYYLSWPNYITGSVSLYTIATTATAGAGPTIAGIPASAYTLSTGTYGGLITFATPIAAGASSPIYIGARSIQTAFSDAQLTDFLTRASALYSDDATILKRAQYDIIDVLLTDRERAKKVVYGDYQTDLSDYMASLRFLKTALQADLEGGPTPGATNPVFGVGKNPARPYGPIR